MLQLSQNYCFSDYCYVYGNWFLIIFHFLLTVDTGVWTNVTSATNGPSARFSVAGDCLDPFKGGVLVFIGGCNKSLEALDDMYYLYTGSAKWHLFAIIKFYNITFGSGISLVSLINYDIYLPFRDCSGKWTETREVIFKEAIETEVPRTKSQSWPKSSSSKIWCGFWYGPDHVSVEL